MEFLLCIFLNCHWLTAVCTWPIPNSYWATHNPTSICLWIPMDPNRPTAAKTRFPPLCWHLVLKGLVWSQSWAIFQMNRGPVRSQKFPEPKKCGPGLQKTTKNQSKPVCSGPGLNVLKSSLNQQRYIVRINYSLIFYVNVKPIIIKIGWELNKLWYISWMSKIWHATFVAFTVFLFVLSQFLSNLDEKKLKFS